MSNNTNNPDDQTSWFLRTADGSVFGPTDIDTLKDWCLQGRIEPDNELSDDQQTWILAESLPELEMDWFAKLEDGTLCGPFNLNLIGGLIESGSIPESATLENRYSAEVRPLPVTSETDTQSIVDPLEQEETAESDGTTVATHAPTDADIENQQDAETDDDGLPLSKRLEPLQRSAAEARSQLNETRQHLQHVRAEYTVLQDDAQRMRDDLAIAEKARQKSDDQLLQQQDRAARAEADIENLKGQLEQLKDHYDRLQLENQNQFEQIDAQRASLISKEQGFKRDLASLRSDTDAKTEILAEAVHVLMQDEDLARHLKNTPAPVAIAQDSGETEKLKAANQRLQQQLELERDQSLLQIQRLQSRRRSPFLLILLITALAALLLSTIILAWKWVGSDSGGASGVRGNTRTDRDVPPTTFEEPASQDITGGNGLDLLPDTSPLPDIQQQTSNTGTGTQQWPTITLPHATIARTDRTMRIVFNYGIFDTATRLTSEAIDDLTSLAAQLNGKLGKHQLMIEGHTDATPILASGSRYVDNFALGMARAEAVKTFLATRSGSGIPAEAMRTASAGDASPPFSNDTEADRMKNRTVVLTLISK